MKFVIPLLFVMCVSCTTGRDMYSYPEQPIKNKKEYREVKDSTPAWLYAVSNSFIVGNGSGKNLQDAKRSALNDVKAQIVKRIGEVADVVEVSLLVNENSRQPVTTDKFARKRHFYSKYKPIIYLSQDGFDAFFHRQYTSRAEYFVKYKITEAELVLIRKKCISEIEAKRFKIDSVLNRKIIVSSLEELTREVHVLEDLSYYLNKQDSLRCKNKLERLKKYFSNIQVKVENEEEGALKLSFTLNGNPIDLTDYLSVSMDNIKLENQIRLGHEYVLIYDKNSIQNPTDTINILLSTEYGLYDYPIVLDVSAFRMEVEQKGTALLIPRKDGFFGGSTKIGLEILLNTNYQGVMRIERLELVPNGIRDHSLPMVYELNEVFLTQNEDAVIKIYSQEGPIAKWYNYRSGKRFNLLVYCRDVKSSKMEVVELKNIALRH